MKHKIAVIRKNEFQTSQWPGGTTTQLYIYPMDAKYAERNFKWRLSSAKVETQESLFTHLPGISRIIMIIEGDIVLQHEGKHTAVLHPFEQDSFVGDWTTKSIGKVTDFNLMLTDGCAGKLEAILLEGRTYTNTPLNGIKEKSEYTTNAFYITNGGVSFTLHDSKVDLNEGDLFVITLNANDEDLAVQISNNLDKEAKIIRALISY